MKVKNYFKMSILSSTQNEAFVRSTVAAFCSNLNPSVEQINDIKTSVSEAFTNCIVHAYNNEPGEVVIETTIFENGVEIKIEDSGCGVADIEKAMEPFYTTKPEQERSGMGFTLMQAFMNDIQVISEVGRGTTVIMTKLLPDNAVAWGNPTKDKGGSGGEQEISRRNLVGEYAPYKEHH